MNKQQEIVVVEAMWNDRFCGVASSEREARELAYDHHAYGEPEDVDDYHLGTRWASDDDEKGWRIAEKTVNAHLVEGKLCGDVKSSETVHLSWSCPVCDRPMSEDVFPEDESPMLLFCTCGGKPERQYVLVAFG